MYVCMQELQRCMGNSPCRRWAACMRDGHPCRRPCLPKPAACIAGPALSHSLSTAVLTHIEARVRGGGDGLLGGIRRDGIMMARKVVECDLAQVRMGFVW